MDQAHTAQDEYPNDNVEDANLTDTFQDDNPGGTAQDHDHRLAAEMQKISEEHFFQGPGYPGTRTMISSTS